MRAEAAMGQLRAARAQLFAHSQQRIKLMRYRSKGVASVTAKQIADLNERIADARAKVQAARDAVKAALLAEPVEES